MARRGAKLGAARSSTVWRGRCRGSVASVKVKAERVFHALGDPTRRAMVETLRRGPVSFSRLAERLGLTLAVVGQPLQVLEESGLALTEKSGRGRTCRLETAGF